MISLPQAMSSVRKRFNIVPTHFTRYLGHTIRGSWRRHSVHAHSPSRRRRRRRGSSNPPRHRQFSRGGGSSGGTRKRRPEDAPKSRGVRAPSSGACHSGEMSGGKNHQWRVAWLRRVGGWSARRSEGGGRGSRARGCPTARGRRGRAVWNSSGDIGRGLSRPCPRRGISQVRRA